MPVNGDAIVKRYEAMVRDASNFRTRWENMAPLLAPSRRGIVSSQAPGESQMAGVYDSTMAGAAETFAMFFAGRVMNPADRWLNYAMQSQTGRRLDAVREWLEDGRDRTLRRLDHSMFYGESPESLVDWSGFGTGCLLVDEMPQPVNRTISGFRGFHVQAIKTGRFQIADGPDGLVDTLGVEQEMTARACEAQWGREALPKSIREAVENEKYEQPFKILHWIAPRTNADQRSGAGATAMPWVSVWIEMKEKAVIRESGYHVFPAAIPRYHRTPGEVFGRGPGDLAFPDAWSLNTAKQMGFEDWAMKIRPPILMRHNAVIGSLRLTPGQPTLVKASGTAIRDVIQPYETGSRPEVSQIKEEELRRSIREMFFVDTIRQLLQVEKSEMTAYEFAQKLNLLFRMVATAYGRYKREGLQRIVEICWTLQYHAGDFAPPPPEVAETDGNITVEFENPIVRAQRAGDAEAVTLYINDFLPLAQVDPALFTKAVRRLDLDKASSGMADIRGVPAIWVKSDEELAAEDEAAAQQAQQMQQMQAVLGATEAMKNAAPMVKAVQPKGGGV